MLTMVIVDPNIKYNPFGSHIFVNPFSLYAPFVQLTHLFQDGFMKWYDDQLMVFHITHGIPHKISCLGQ
jgi:hypothetical protein